MIYNKQAPVLRILPLCLRYPAHRSSQRHCAALRKVPLASGACLPVRLRDHLELSLKDSVRGGLSNHLGSSKQPEQSAAAQLRGFAV